MLTLKQSHKFKEYLDTIVLLKVTAQLFERQFCITLQRYHEDGLGPAIGGVIHNPSGIHFLVQELEQVKHPRICISVPSSQASLASVDNILHLLSLTEDDCYWTIKDGYEDIPHSVFREDDKGNQSIEGTYSTKIEAALRIEELATNHHKQFYWTQAIPEKR